MLYQITIWIKQYLARGGAEAGGAEAGGAEAGGAEAGGTETGGAETGSAETGSAETGSAETGGAEMEDDELDSGDDFDEDIIFFMSSIAENNKLNLFENWLQSIDGGQKNTRSAKKHTSVLMGILRCKSSIDVHIRNLLTREFLYNWMKDVVDSGKESGTIKTYLNSVRLYIDYVLLKDNLESKKIHSLNCVKGQIKKWCCNLYKGIQRRKYKKNLLDIEKFPTSEDMKKMDNPERVKNTFQYLRHLTCTHVEPCKSRFKQIRDYLLSTLLIDNCSRPGGVHNITLEEFEKAIPDENNRRFVIQVFKHKTDFKGPVDISVNSDELFQCLSNYVTHVRNRLPNISSNGCDPLFVSFAGGKMSTSLVGKFIFLIYQICVNVSSNFGCEWLGITIVMFLKLLC